MEFWLYTMSRLFLAINILAGISIMGWHPSIVIFLTPHHLNQYLSMGYPHLNMKTLNLRTTPPPLKSEGPFQKMIPRKNEIPVKQMINTCVSVIKQHWKKMAEIPQKHNFLTWSIQSFVRKVKQFVRKCYITGAHLGFSEGRGSNFRKGAN